MLFGKIVLGSFQAVISMKSCKITLTFYKNVRIYIIFHRSTHIHAAVPKSKRVFITKKFLLREYCSYVYVYGQIVILLIVSDFPVRVE